MTKDDKTLLEEIVQAMAEIEYCEHDKLTEHERNCPRGSAWAVSTTSWPPPAIS